MDPDALRKPLLVAATALVTLVLAIELANNVVTGWFGVERPGWGILALAWVDGVLWFRLVVMALAIVIPPRTLGRVQGPVTLVGSLLALIGAVVIAFVILAELLLMIALVSAVPFGTAVYASIWGGFGRSAAAGALAVILGLKMAAVILLILAHPKFLKVKALVVLVLFSLLGNLIVKFLHGLVPLFVVSITDAIAGLVVTVLGIVWLVMSLVGSIPAVLKLLRVDKALAGSDPVL